MTSTGLVTPPPRRARRLRSGQPARRSVLRQDRVALGLTIFLGLLVLVAVLAPVLAPYAPDETDILSASQGPSAAHLLGTDALGRDLLSRLIYGTRLSLLGPVVVIGVATVCAVALVLSSVWIGGRYDRFVGKALSVLFSFPGLILAIVVVAIVGAGITGPIVAFSIAFIPYIARVLRPVALRERSMTYVNALQMLGVSGWTICVRHLLPNIFPFVRAHVTIALGTALVDLAAVSYIGLGVQAPAAEWGLQISTGQADLLAGKPWESLTACVAVLVVVIAVNILGERLAAAAQKEGR
ncbi:ABC transporter permease [Mumia sp. DW29H23]|uniref:ABC transporter permease n=1 Tax=Mumia sp. DW29H23 TaxID=3421241 RepID=UPI003D689629